MSSAIKVQRDAGCAHDVVSTSLVLKGGGKTYIRVRAPKYLDAANRIIAVTKEKTMYIPQLDEMAEIMCLANTPSVFSIGKRCVTMGYAFFWPPFSDYPFFVKPDGARVIMDIEVHIPYLTGGTVESACPAEQSDGPDNDHEDPDICHATQ
jgi:hypothetical protein